MSLLAIGCSSNGYDPNDSAYPKDSISLRAKEAYENNDIETAINLYSIAVLNDTSNPINYFNRGKCYAILLEPRKAEEDFLTAARKNYRISSCYYNIGTSYCHINDSLAVYYLKKCLEVDPSHQKARKRLIICKSPN